MSLAQKTALIVVLYAIANVAIGYSIHRNVVAPEFADLEQREVAKNMQRAFEAIQREAAFLDVLAHDVASWDATYEFAETHDREFYALNLSPAALKTSALDWAIAVDAAGELISGPVRDIRTGEKLAIDELSARSWSRAHPLLAGDTRLAPIAGLFGTSAGAMLVAARDILTSVDSGPSRGRIVMGRRFDNAFVAGVAQRTHIDLAIWPIGSDEIAPEVRGALLREGGSMHTVVEPEGERLDVYAFLRDIAGEPVLILRASLPRDITLRAAYVNRLSLLWLLVQGIALAFLIVVPLNRAILAPLGALTRQLRAIRKSNDLTLGIALERSDEIGELGHEFNRLFDQLNTSVAERRKSDAALRHSEERLREAQQVAQLGSWELDLRSGTWWWSNELYRIHDRSIDDGPPTRDEIRASIHPNDRDRVEAAFRALLDGESNSAGVECRFVLPSGEVRHHQVRWSVERTDAGQALRAFGTVSDVTERYRSEEATRRAAAVFDTATEGIVIADPSGTIIDVNSAFSSITGHLRHEIIGESAALLDCGRHDFEFFQRIAAEIEQAGRWEGEIWIRHKDGRPIPAWVSIGRTVGREAATEQVVAVFNDMTERKNAEEVIARQATYDLLTGIPNRALFIDRLSQETLRCDQSGQGVALIFIDLDDFKKVNDTIGHAAGDETLRITAQRIKQSIRAIDTAARVGGDEFAVIVPRLHDAVDAEAVAQRILAAMAVPMRVQGQDVLTTASIGISVYPADSADDSELLRNADIAMYRSKKSGGNSIEFFTQEMNERALRRIQVESHLQGALENREFEVHYQPIVELPDGRMVGVEALLRWHSPELGTVSPSEFIPIAESTGSIVAIGAWALETACRQVKSWQDAGWTDLRVAVNFSPREVDRGDAIKSISDALNRSGLAPEHLEIEVTERVLLDDVERAGSTFGRLKDLGVRLCVDDFGTGYSSLSYLRNYPFDVLKIDRAFVYDAVSHESGVPLLRAIIAMADSLGLDVIAEGVESEAQVKLLSDLGCGYAQGHYFCAPLSAARIGIGAPVVEGAARSERADAEPQGWLRALKVRDE